MYWKQNYNRSIDDSSVQLIPEKPRLKIHVEILNARGEIYYRVTL